SRLVLAYSCLSSSFFRAYRPGRRDVHSFPTRRSSDLDWAHLISNSIGLLVLGTIIALSGMKPLLKVTLVSWVLSGAVSWLIGGVGTMHIGASGIVFGYIFYVIVRGLFTRRFLHLVVGLVIGFYYGLGALAGLSPLQDGISWQGHLGGTIGGVL